MVNAILILSIFFVGVFAKPLKLSQDERQMLQTHPLSCISTDLWPPFNTTVDGKLAGIGIDYWKKICEKLDIPFKCTKAKSWSEVLLNIKNKKYDLTVATQQTPDRLSYAVFSRPYDRYPLVIATRNDIGFINAADLLKNKKIAIGRNYAAAFMIHKNYPQLHIVEVDSLKEALKLVSEGKVYAAIDAFPVVAFMLNKNTFSNLKISGTLPETFSPKIMLRKDLANIVPLINKAIDSISEDEKKKIHTKWIKTKGLNHLPVVYFYVFFALLFVLVLWLIAWIQSLKKEIGNKNKDLKYFEELASFDSLTLIYNRHMLDTILAQQLAIAKRYRQLMSVIFFDVDDFKVINDKYGHNAGDDVLIELTRLVSGTIRGSDIFGRWGGDEFMIILPESSQKQAKRLVDILNTRIRNHVFSAVEHISCSFGVASYQYGDSVKDLLHRVDIKLYEAKKNKHKDHFHK